MANKTINGKQCTFVWHVNDLNLSHVDGEVLEELLKRMEAKYGKEAPLTVNRASVHECLGMKLDYSKYVEVLVH